MKRILEVIALTLAASALAMGQAPSSKEAQKLQVEINTTTRALQGWVVREPILIVENTDYSLDVYSVTTNDIKSISSGSIRFRNERAGNFVIPKSASPEETTEMLTAIEKAKTTEEMNAVLRTYRPKSLRWEEGFADPPSMMELFKNKSFDKNWRMVKSTSIKLADQQGKVTASIAVKDLVGFKVLEK